MSKKKLWSVMVTNGTNESGYLRENSSTVAVYTTEADAIKETKWLNAFHKKSGNKITYKSVRWKDDGTPTSMQDMEAEETISTYSKMVTADVDPEKTKSNLTSLFVVDDES